MKLELERSGEGRKVRMGTRYDEYDYGHTRLRLRGDALR